MEVSWDEYRRKLREEIPPSMVSLASEARLSNCWIYHHTTKKWYTPEEFLEHARVLFKQKRDKDNMKEFAVMDPMAGLRVRMETMRKVSEEVMAFQNRINEYFNVKLEVKRRD